MEAKNENKDIAGPSNSNASDAITKDHGPLTEFTCFSELPVELSREIFKHACFVPRVIDVFPMFCPDMGMDWDDLDGMDESTALTSVTQRVAPAVLHVSREARELRVFPEHLDYDFDYRPPAKVYVNWACDTICPTACFDNYNFEGNGTAIGSALTQLKSLPKLRHLAVTVSGLKALKKSLPKLAIEVITVYLAPGLDNWSSDMAEDEMEGGCACCQHLNSNTKFGINLTIPGEYLEAQAERFSKGEDAEVNEDEVEYDKFLPRVSASSVRAASKNIVNLFQALVKKEKAMKEAGRVWKAPRFQVMVMEVHEKENYDAHEQERYRAMKAAAAKVKAASSGIQGDDMADGGVI
ncbi:uncharacterized protein LY89DRAFT_674195 [Mollisia scopiformis]|uniref:2EXR domain-containing protein n=1 Tax=Mollisia scopiformis TaxID=149040 RepID=A0A194WVC4_MOLSC|nr:uncharacterized protein LY89DRAFT_674195 [Mollisia scopiformis]KUJ11619.1 hypothetical protein LY89DRAFT_674195 [Mollisia scopiformis]